ncbi:ABC transporter ATP-binding protein [Spiractinospora alimapuensis]|uniref:ABC transporter ATP-binding protein n=1 Tax=Spiractinospora alimapuensis TaxID=2820884 RepID=UPI001F41F119|nr:ABC transporter ATP-binding protein [Spiractinospora alimapuensis]QVQ52166.1 ABC transporter ATP-binding protein [Spiractinospora alimapuensis]
MGEVAVEVTGLVKRYGAVEALSGVDFVAPRGAVTALLGPNGAGKTTTVEICEGYRRADAGTVRILGLDPTSDDRALKARVGVMPQEAGAPTGARAGEWLRLIASFHAHPVPPAALLRRLGLLSCSDTPVRRLSGGQRQRLSLAGAVVGRPELVFLDEPTAGLDPQARAATWELLGELRDSGVSTLVTTHYMEEAERLADHVVIIDRGTVVATGSPAELTGTRTQVRFHASPSLELSTLRDRLPVGCTVEEASPGSYAVLAEDGQAPALLTTVAAWCADNDIPARELGARGRTLEDVFLDLTGRELREK